MDYALRVLLGGDSVELLQCRKVLYQRPHDGLAADAGLYVVPSGFWGETYATRASLPRLPLQEIQGVPILFGTPHIRRVGDALVIDADIIASTFFLVTRYEEIVRRDVRDEHGRFPGKESLPYRAGFLHRPIVEEYAGLLRKWLREIGIECRGRTEPLRVLLTHDVDNLREYPNRLRCLAGALKSRLLGRRTSSHALSVALALGKDPLDTFDQIIASDVSLRPDLAGVPSESVYFFMAADRGSPRCGYDVRSSPARTTIKTVCQSGATVGLHASYAAGMDPELISKEKARLEEVCGFPIRRNRHHYLAWREVEDGWALARAGIDWDSTLGYADAAGFRLGVCHPIPLFDPIRMRLFGIEEHPLVVMDGTLSDPRYMGLGETEATVCCKRLLDETRQFEGEFVVLWHNSSFRSRPGSYLQRLYVRLLAELASG